MTKKILLAAVITLTACRTAHATPENPEPGEILDYCDRHECESMPWPNDQCQSRPGGLYECCDVDNGCVVFEAVKFCCDLETGACVETTLLSNCDPDDYVAICEWGQTNPDGSITCYD